MSRLVDFADRVQKRLASAKREPRWEPDEAKRFMDDVDARRQHFEEVAVRLNDAVIQR